MGDLRELGGWQGEDRGPGVHQQRPGAGLNSTQDQREFRMQSRNGKEDDLCSNPILLK